MLNIQELKQENTETYAVLSYIIQEKARQLTANLPRFREMGLERVIELIEGWLENGQATIIADDSIDGVRLVLEGEIEEEAEEEV